MTDTTLDIFKSLNGGSKFNRKRFSQDIDLFENHLKEVVSERNEHSLTFLEKFSKNFLGTKHQHDDSQESSTFIHDENELGLVSNFSPLDSVEKV